MATFVSTSGTNVTYGTSLPPKLYGELTAGVGAFPGDSTVPLSGNDALRRVETWLRSEEGKAALQPPADRWRDNGSLHVMGDDLTLRKDDRTLRKDALALGDVQYAHRRHKVGYSWFDHSIAIGRDSFRHAINLCGHTGSDRGRLHSSCALSADWETGLASAVEFTFNGTESINAALQRVGLLTCRGFVQDPTSFVASLAVLLGKAAKSDCQVVVKPALIPEVLAGTPDEASYHAQLQPLQNQFPVWPFVTVELCRVGALTLPLASIAIDLRKDRETLQVSVSGLDGLDAGSAFFQWMKSLRDYFFGAIVG